MENREIDRMITINDAGHDYDLHNVEGGADSVQKIVFIKKTPIEGTTELHTEHNGTTTEAVLQVALHRLEVLEERLPDSYNREAIAAIGVALGALENRTKRREERGVEGTHQA